MNQFITLAVAEKMSSLATVEYLKERARRGSRQKFEAVLASVPDLRRARRKSSMGVMINYSSVSHALILYHVFMSYTFLELWT